MTRNPVKKFFLFCSGASGAVLNEKGCEVEHSKYAGIGATIFFTAALAALSGGYALFTVFRSPGLSAAFGLFWGLIIFNLDRFIVSSIRKTRGAKVRSEIRKALPRLLLAVFISIVITRPMELKLFEVEIEGQITKDLIKERADLEGGVSTEYGDIPQLEQDTEELRSRRTQLQNEWNERTKAARGELEGWDGTNKPGDGPEYKRRLAEAEQAKQELDAFKGQYDPIITANEAQINKRKQERDARIAAAKADVDNSRGLLKRLEALSTLTSSHLSVLFASVFIVLLFISLETAPILVKLFSSRGPYDDYLDAAEHQVYAARQKEMSDINDEINTDVALGKQRNADRLQAELQLHRQLNAERVQAELKLNQETMTNLENLVGQALHDAQVEIAKTFVARWRASQLRLLTQTAPGASYYGQPATPAGQSAAPPGTHASPQNSPPPSGSAGPPPATAGSAPPPTASPSNNGGARPSAMTSTAGVQPSAPSAASHGPPSPAQQISAGAGPQSGAAAAQSPAGSNHNTTVP